MSTKKKNQPFLNRFVKDCSGAFSLLWSLSFMGLMLSVGAAYDVSQLARAKALAQDTADNMALSASISVDLNNRDRLIENHVYGYTELGFGSQDFTKSINGYVQYNVVDDKDANNVDLAENDKTRLLARSHVSGIYKPVFMSMLPQFGSLNFHASSDVAYAAKDGIPASIFFVVDNSGSMNYNDDNGQKKISSLKISMKNFMETLGKIVVYGDDIFRTALYPYNYSLITTKMVSPDWQTLSNYDIDRMTANGGTRSTSALARALSDFNQEDQIHENINGEENPLKFLIFMSDGMNNGVVEQCGSGQMQEHWIDTYQGWNTIYYSTRSWFDDWVIHYPSTCAQHSSVNVASLQHCTFMKAHGVTIYAIAYDVAEDEREMAEAFMKQCSSGVEDFYKYATNGTDLQDIFNEIGNAVVREVVRIKH